MVKGITRQVVVVKGTDSTPFDQAIFLVRDSVLSKGGVTEDALLHEARNICKASSDRKLFHPALWSGIGAAVVGLVWLGSTLLL